MIKFLPSFVGSKAYWIKHLQSYCDRDFVEFFAGSAVISANLARTTILNDMDLYLYKYYKYYLYQPMIQDFTDDDYFFCRRQKNWYAYLYYLQKMSFSGVYRHSKSGYNVPIKKDLSMVQLVPDLKISINRFKKLEPTLYNNKYNEFNFTTTTDIAILDPPYEKSKADYNKYDFDYSVYWEFVSKLFDIFNVIILFDTVDNMPFAEYTTRKMRVNGKYKGNEEAMFIFDKQKKIGQTGEKAFYEKNKKYLIRTDGLQNDFIFRKDLSIAIELKTDLYDMNKTPNYFMERWSNKQHKTPGGPWAAYAKGCKYFVYFFIKNDTYYVFDIKRLIDKLDDIIKDMPLISIMNTEWTTQGYKINRQSLDDCILHNFNFETAIKRDILIDLGYEK